MSGVYQDHTLTLHGQVHGEVFHCSDVICMKILKGQNTQTWCCHLESNVTNFNRTNNNIIMHSTAIRCQFGKNRFPIFFPTDVGKYVCPADIQYSELFYQNVGKLSHQNCGISVAIFLRNTYSNRPCLWRRNMSAP